MREINRTIKFRGLTESGEWMVGDLVHTDGNVYVFPKDALNSPDNYEVKPETVGQYTGLKDKNGVEIYEGDIIEWYTNKRFVQQSHEAVRPEIDELYLVKQTSAVVFADGVFSAKENASEDYLYPLSFKGFESVQQAREVLFNYESRLTEEEMQHDFEGTPINEDIVGIKVLGNIHQNPDLLTK